jgi:hypothetical protein
MFPYAYGDVLLIVSDAFKTVVGNLDFVERTQATHNFYGIA